MQNIISTTSPAYPRFLNIKNPAIAIEAAPVQDKPIIPDNPLACMITLFQYLETDNDKTLAAALQDQRFHILNLRGIPASLMMEEGLAYKVDTKGIETLFRALKNNTTVTSLRLHFNKIGDDDARIIAENLRGNTTLIQLELSENDIGDDGIEALMKSLENNTTLTYLDLSGNHLGERGVDAILKTLEKNSALTYVGIYRNEKLGNKVYEHAAKIREFTSLNLKRKSNATENRNSGNASSKPVIEDSFFAHELTDNDALTIAQWLKEHPKKISLDLSKTHFSTDGIEALGKALKENKVLISFSLIHNHSDNYSGDEIAATFGKALKLNKNLTSLDLQSNQIGIQGATEMSASLIMNSTLTTLNLYNNRISNKGAQLFGMMLTLNRTLTSLNLSKNKINDEGAKAIAAGLARNTTLTSLDLRRNNISHKGQKDMFALAFRKTLQIRFA